jgi:hypothetical protein
MRQPVLAILAVTHVLAVSGNDSVALQASVISRLRRSRVFRLSTTQTFML